MGKSPADDKKKLVSAELGSARTGEETGTELSVHNDTEGWVSSASAGPASKDSSKKTKRSNRKGRVVSPADALNFAIQAEEENTPLMPTVIGGGGYGAAAVSNDYTALTMDLDSQPRLNTDEIAALQSIDLDDWAKKFFSIESHFTVNGTLKAPPNLKDPYFMTAYFIAFFAASLYLGPNWFNNDQDGVAMKWIHTMASLTYNFTVNGYYTEYTLREVKDQLSCIHEKYQTAKYAEFGIKLGDFGVQTAFAYLASAAYADMSPQVPWGGNAGAQQVYFILYTFLNKAGIKQLLHQDFYPFITQQWTRLRLLVAADQFRYKTCNEKFVTDLHHVVVELLQEASRELKSGKLTINGKTPQDRALSLVAEAKNLPPDLLRWFSKFATPLLGLVAILGTLGLMNDTTQVSGFYYTLTAYSSIAALVGLTLRNAGDLARAFVSMIYNVTCGVPLITGMSNCAKFWRALELIGVSIAIFAGAYFTARASTETLEPIGQEQLVASFWLSIYEMCAYASAIMFNGTPFVGLYLLFRLYNLRKQYEPLVDHTRIADELLECFGKAAAYEEKVKLLSELEFAVPSSIRTQLEIAATVAAKSNIINKNPKLRFNFSADQKTVQLRGANLSRNPTICNAMGGINPEQLHTVLWHLASDNPDAAGEVLMPLYQHTAGQAKLDIFDAWVINTLIPTAAFAAAKLFVDGDEPFALIFTVTLLLKAFISNYWSAIKKPSRGIVCTVAAAIGTGMFALAAKEVAGPATTAATNDSDMAVFGEILAAGAAGNIFLNEWY